MKPGMPSGSLPPLRDVIARYGLAARKGLGQHFLLDLNLTRKIVETAGVLDGSTVFEIGPGPGGLTRALLDSKARKIIAVEKDKRCVLALADLAATSKGRLEILEGDALKIDLTTLAPPPRVIVANLPYNVGTPLLLGWLKQIADMQQRYTRLACEGRHPSPEHGSKGLYEKKDAHGKDRSWIPALAGMTQDEAFRSLTLMFQAEVADRLIAKPGTKAYGRLSVMAQFCCGVTRVMTLPARAFTPPPKVDSAVVHLVPRKDRPKDISFESMEIVTASAFGQRRKMLRSAFKALGGEAFLEKAGIASHKRAEELSVAEFESLARNLGRAP